MNWCLYQLTPLLIATAWNLTLWTLPLCNVLILLVRRESRLSPNWKETMRGGWLHQQLCHASWHNINIKLIFYSVGWARRLKACLRKESEYSAEMEREDAHTSFLRETPWHVYVGALLFVILGNHGIQGFKLFYTFISLKTQGFRILFWNSVMLMPLESIR